MMTRTSPRAGTILSAALALLSLTAAGRQEVSARPVLEFEIPFPVAAAPDSATDANTRGATSSSSSSFSSSSSDTLLAVPFPDALVVTATRMPVKRSQTGRMVTVIDRQTLRAWPGSSVARVIDGLGGAYVNGAAGSPGTNPSLFLRGAGSGQILVLLDGVPVSDASRIDNSFDLNLLDAAWVERVEILRGAQSTLWGSDAVAGVVNVITRRGEAGQVARPQVSASVGSHGSSRLEGGVSGASGRMRYRLMAGMDRSAGFSAAIDSVGGTEFDADGWARGTVLAGVGRRFGEATRVDLSAQWSGYRADLDAGAYADDRDMTSRNRHQVLRAELDHAAERWQGRLVQSVTFTERRVDDDSTHVGGFNLWSEDRYKGWTAVTDAYASTSPAPGLTILAGGQYMWQASTQAYRSLSAFGPWDSVPLGRDSVRAGNASLYGSLRWEPTERLVAETGARVNLHSEYGRAATFTFNPSWILPGSRIRLFGNLGSGYKIPSLYQLHSEYGNRALRPERSLNLDLGADWHSADRDAHVRIAAFVRRVDELITFAVPPGSWTGRYENRDVQHDRGLELEAGAQLHPALRFTGSLALVRGEGRVDGERVRNLYRRPNAAARVELSWAPRTGPLEGFSLRPSMRLVGERLNGPYDPGPRMLPAFQIVDLSAVHRLRPGLDVFAQIENLGDRSWVEVSGYATKGRTGWFGVRLGW